MSKITNTNMGKRLALTDRTCSFPQCLVTGYWINEREGWAACISDTAALHTRLSMTE